MLDQPISQVPQAGANRRAPDDDADRSMDVLQYGLGVPRHPRRVLLAVAPLTPVDGAAAARAPACTTPTATTATSTSRRAGRRSSASASCCGSTSTGGPTPTISTRSPRRSALEPALVARLAARLDARSHASIPTTSTSSSRRSTRPPRRTATPSRRPSGTRSTSWPATTGWSPSTTARSRPRPPRRDDRGRDAARRARRGGLRGVDRRRGARRLPRGSSRPSSARSIGSTSAPSATGRGTTSSPRSWPCVAGSACIRRTLAPHRVAFAALARPEMELHEELGRPWPGLTERLERTIDAVENLRDLLLGTFDIHMGRAAQDANDVMKVLTLCRPCCFRPSSWPGSWA